MLRGRESESTEPQITLLTLIRDVFDHAFQDNCQVSTYAILSMTCKHFYSMFHTKHSKPLSHSFLEEDNLLWYKNMAWCNKAAPLFAHGGLACMTKYMKDQYNV